MKNQTKKLEDDGWGTKGISKADGANEKAKAVWDEYLKAANLDPSKYKLTDTTGSASNRKFVYNDENGEKKEITLDQMRATKASSEALKELDSTAEQITKDF
jgi:dsRNA-specific ribonuclease